MAREITCSVVSMKEGVELPSPELVYRGSTPAEHLLQAANRNGPALRLSMEYPDDHTATLRPDEPTSAWSLHTFLEGVTGNILQTRPAERVGLLVSDYWPHDESILGVMFDTTFSTEFTPGGGFGSVPREGCAVFLGALSDLRSDREEYERATFFTCVHELGHLFNLWHDESRPNFLRTPKANEPVEDEDFRFTATHSNFLTHVETAPEVFPGGNDFGVRGLLGQNSNEEAVHLRADQSNRALRLEIEASQDDFAFFEPVELDIRLVTYAQRARLESNIDPGHSDFVIWIEQPDGTRRRYRPLRRYCGGEKKIEVRPDSPFTRDLSVFIESGGYTFRNPGSHKVFATLMLPNNQVLRSNSITLNVRNHYGKTAFGAHLQQVMTRRQVAGLLYHRSGRFHHSVVEATNELARRSRDGMIKANLYYALGRYLRWASVYARTRKTQKKYRNRASDFFERCISRPELSSQRRQNAESELAELCEN